MFRAVLRHSILLALIWPRSARPARRPGGGNHFDLEPSTVRAEGPWPTPAKIHRLPFRVADPYHNRYAAADGAKMTGPCQEAWCSLPVRPSAGRRRCDAPAGRAMLK